MKPRKPIRRISKKRLEREFAGVVPYSTIKRKPSWNASTAEDNSTCSSSTIGTAKRSVRMNASRSSKPPKRKWIRRIGKKWLSKPAVIYRGVKEICNPATPEGRAEREWRKILMYVRQNGRCSIGREKLRLVDAVFEHATPKGMGSVNRDDRICDENGRAINSVACAFHNSIKGSRRDVHIEFGDNTSDMLEIILKGITI